MADEPGAAAAAPATDAATTEKLPPAADSTTLGTDGDAAGKPSAPPDWPDDWRERAAGDDEKLLGQLRRYSNPKNLIKSWREQREVVSKMPPKKPEGDDAEALKAWRQQAGLPLEPKEYIAKLPEGLVIGEEDMPRIESFLTDMHSADVPPPVVHKALEWYYNTQAQALVERQAADKETRTKAEDALYQEWGSELKPNLNGAQALFDAYGNEGLRERFYSARFPDGTLVGNDPDALRFLVSLSRELNPQGTVVPATGTSVMQTLQQEKTQLETEMADTRGQKYDYWQNPAKQERYRFLLNMEDKHNSRNAA